MRVDRALKFHLRADGRTPAIFTGEDIPGEQ
jgi:hypothetical protein